MMYINTSEMKFHVIHSDLFTTSQKTKHLCYKDNGSMPFMEIIVARFDVLTSLLMKIQMSRCVDWRIVTDVSNERSSFNFRIRQFKISAHCSWVEDFYVLMYFEVLRNPEILMDDYASLLGMLEELLTIMLEFQRVIWQLTSSMDNPFIRSALSY